MVPMRRSIFLFFLLFSFAVYSQTYKELAIKVQNFFSQGNYGIALVFAEQAAVQAEKEFGNSDTSYAKALNNLAMVYQKRLRYLDAERTFQKTLKIKEKAVGTSNFSYSTTLINLADLYKTRKDYVKAFEYYQLAANIDKGIVGENSEIYASNLANLGRISYFLQDIGKAFNYLGSALKIREKTLGKDNAQYAVNQVYLADVYQLTGDYHTADSLYKLGLSILTYKIGTIHPLFLGALRQLANLYIQKGELRIADSLLFNALSIIEPRYTKKSLVFFDFLGDYATLKLKQGDLIKAEELGIEVYNGRKELLDSLHPDINKSALHLAKVFFKQDRFEESSIMLAEIFGRCLDIRQVLYPALPIPDIQLVEKDAEEAFGLYNSIFMKKMASNDEIRHLAFNNYLILSMLNPGKYWFSKKQLDGKYLTEEESDYVFWLRHAEYYCNLKLLPKKDLAAWNENLETVYNAVTSTASRLASDSVFAKSYLKFSFEWKEYLKTLAKDEVTIVILRGETNSGEYPGENSYGALILDGEKDSDPRFMEIKEGNKLEEEVLADYKKADSDKRGTKFYKELWGDISAVLTNKKKLHIKLSGIYKQVAIELLFDQAQGKTLGELYQIESE